MTDDSSTHKKEAAQRRVEIKRFLRNQKIPFHSKESTAILQQRMNFVRVQRKMTDALLCVQAVINAQDPPPGFHGVWSDIESTCNGALRFAKEIADT